MGVDSGLKKHYVIGNAQGIFKVGTTDDWNDIEELMKVYDIEACVIDALPDLTEPRKLRDKYLGKIWLCYYKKEIQRADFIKWDYQTYTVYADRSKIFQQVIDEMTSKKIRFQMKPQELEEYIRQWGSLYKMTEKDSLGIERDVWESGGEDHFCHATNYFRLALDKGGTARVEEWRKPEKEHWSLAPIIKKFLKPNYE
jgi:GH15 family glucan-1,4-alpha-glucosidase